MSYFKDGDATLPSDWTISDVLEGSNKTNASLGGVGGYSFFKMTNQRRLRLTKAEERNYPPRRCSLKKEREGLYSVSSSEQIQS